MNNYNYTNLNKTNSNININNLITHPYYYMPGTI